MRHCIPDVLFNRIPYPAEGAELTTTDGICRELYYKLPGAEEVVVRREVWHTLCDFCYRTGAWLERREAESESGLTQIPLVSQNGTFLRIVGAEADGHPTTDFDVIADGGDMYARFPDGTESCAVVVSIRPSFADAATGEGGDWNPQVPQFIIDRYGECIAHGALARLYAMRNEGEMARMHAVAYNNDLNRLSFGLITSGMRKHLLIDVEDWLVNTNGNG